MESLLRQNEDWETLPAAELLSWMTTPTTVPKSAVYNASGFMKLLGTEVASQLVAGLRAKGYGLVADVLPTGIDLGDAETQRMLDKLAAEIPAFAPYVPSLKALGQDTRTRWARFSDGEPPTQQEVAEAVTRAQANDKMLAARQWRDSVLLPAVDTAINEGLTVEQIQEAIATL